MSFKYYNSYIFNFLIQRFLMILMTIVISSLIFVIFFKSKHSSRYFGRFIKMNLAQIRSLIFITVVTFVTGEKLNNSDIPNDLHLSNMFPVHYVIKLILPIEKYEEHLPNVTNNYSNFLFRGECNITINILHTMKIIKLHKINPTINHQMIKLIGSNGIMHSPKHFVHYTETEYFGLYFDVYPGLYILKLEVFNSFSIPFTDDNNQNFSRNFYINIKKGTT